MITISPKSIALQFNECITNADLKGLANLMTEDHVFCDTANNRIKGKDNNIVQAWEPFFNFYPGYRNIFENIVARGSTVIMQGYSIVLMRYLIIFVPSGLQKLQIIRLVHGLYILIQKKIEKYLTCNLLYLNTKFYSSTDGVKPMKI